MSHTASWVWREQRGEEKLTRSKNEIMTKTKTLQDGDCGSVIDVDMVLCQELIN